MSPGTILPFKRLSSCGTLYTSSPFSNFYFHTLTRSVLHNNPSERGLLLRTGDGREITAEKCNNLMIAEQTAPLTHRSGLRSLISHVFFLIGNFAQRVRVTMGLVLDATVCVFFVDFYFNLCELLMRVALCVRAPRADLFTSAAVLVRLL